MGRCPFSLHLRLTDITWTLLHFKPALLKHINFKRKEIRINTHFLFFFSPELPPPPPPPAKNEKHEHNGIISPC